MQSHHNVKGLASGRVQGVGFRYFVKRQAQVEQLGGYVRNLADGRVEFQLRGDPAAVARVIEQIRSGPAYARVDQVTIEDIDDIDADPEFTIR